MENVYFFLQKYSEITHVPAKHDEINLFEDFFNHQINVSTLEKTSMVERARATETWNFYCLLTKKKHRLQTDCIAKKNSILRGSFCSTKILDNY